MIKKVNKKTTAKTVKKISTKPYVPNEKEKYMCAKHKKFFTEELVKWKKDIIKSNSLTNLLNSSDDNISSADMVDQASSYTDKTVEMKALSRSRKLIEKIDAALPCAPSLPTSKPGRPQALYCGLLPGGRQAFPKER